MTKERTKHEHYVDQHDIYMVVINMIAAKYGFDAVEDILIDWIDEEDKIMERELGVYLRFTGVRETKNDK